MNPDQGNNFWKETESQGTMPLADNVISGEVQPTQEIPLGASHFAMFPQTNAILALVLAIASFACGGLIMSIPALLVAISAKKITDNNPTHPDRGIANAAYITAIVNICISTLLILAYT
ncbi:MAG: hypothetical protein VYA95_04420, partial [Candidatus Thermoplasmatota archaeon]|nr:hypothetical protein [Candidatus Thermoplasmatota archaeon]